MQALAPGQLVQLLETAKGDRLEALFGTLLARALNGLPGAAALLTGCEDSFHARATHPHLRELSIQRHELARSGVEMLLQIPPRP